MHTPHAQPTQSMRYNFNNHAKNSIYMYIDSMIIIIEIIEIID